jgi:type I restriction enzyme R subunit
VSEAHNLDDFRALWIEQQKRRQLIDHLLGDNFSPEVIREIDQMTDFDLYDFFGHHGYHARALKRPNAAICSSATTSLGSMTWTPKPPSCSRAWATSSPRRHRCAGNPGLWEVPEIKLAGGLDALRVLGRADGRDA